MTRRIGILPFILGLVAVILAAGALRAPSPSRKSPFRKPPPSGAADPIPVAVEEAPVSRIPDPPVVPEPPPVWRDTTVLRERIARINEEIRLAREHMDPEEFRVYLEARRREEADRLGLPEELEWLIGE